MGNEKINLKEIVNELYVGWKDRDKTETLNSPAEVGNSYENIIVEKLKAKIKNWEFIRTPYSRTPADIVGLKKNQSTLCFWLIQVKGGSENHVNKTHEETKTLPKLKDKLISILNKKDNTKKIIISTGFVLLHEQTMPKTTEIKYIKHYRRNLTKYATLLIAQNKVLKSVGKEKT